MGTHMIVLDCIISEKDGHCTYRFRNAAHIFNAVNHKYSANFCRFHLLSIKRSYSCRLLSLNKLFGKQCGGHVLHYSHSYFHRTQAIINGNSLVFGPRVCLAKGLIQQVDVYINLRDILDGLDIKIQ